MSALGLDEHYEVSKSKPGLICPSASSSSTSSSLLSDCHHHYFRFLKFPRSRCWRTATLLANSFSRPGHTAWRLMQTRAPPLAPVLQSVLRSLGVLALRARILLFFSLLFSLLLYHNFYFSQLVLYHTGISEVHRPSLGFKSAHRAPARPCAAPATSLPFTSYSYPLIFILSFLILDVCSPSCIIIRPLRRFCTKRPLRIPCSGLRP